jgi:hypothetical protein
MKVEGPGSLSNSGAAKRAGRSNGSLAGAFARALHGSDEAVAAGVNGAQATGAINPLLNLQEVEDSTSGPSKAKARAEDLLDRRIAGVAAECPVPGGPKPPGRSR